MKTHNSFLIPRAIIMLLGTLLALNSSYAQSLAPQVITTAGERASGTNINLSWTLGEVMVEAYTGSTVVLTQGFQQPDKEATSIEGLTAFGLIKVFPNPTSQALFIERERAEKTLYLKLLDLRGRELMRSSLQGMSGQLDLSTFSRGIYVLQLSDGEREAKTVRVEKM